ncbi:putative meiotically up-regulated gene 70 protein [[Candida] jaroonii]|uniref:Meiotically up-regulated gene 70 protein n=1 Tax=[Candida] jaroonii TaxID=467808 RepID=A0ACA9Y3B5_9ASCO|nr:putative meiotically up-regulated gene 70 protein [[Candida] jaroonii]
MRNSKIDTVLKMFRKDELDSRKRQSKRDENIRKRIEHDLNKKRKNVHSTYNRRKGLPGTVLSLRPSSPIICKKTSSVFEVSQIMTAKRENCILVVDDKGDLKGIFTAKDLAFRIVGSGLNANNVTIDQIMTPNPLSVNSITPASDALTLMVEKGFRHLPILDNESNDIIGVLDITKCYSQQMEKLEKLHQSSKKLYEALDNVNSQLGNQNQPLQVFKYFEDLKDKMNGPTLDSVLDDSTVPVYCSIRTTVYEATVLMKQHNTTAVLVKDLDDKVNGIFTSKDVVLRVIATGLDPKNCSIIRVMTPKPDLATQTLSIQEALRKMFDGHYLNLPVVDDDKEIIGIVDVLKLTYATLNQIKQIDGEEVEMSQTITEKDEGPAWNKFWTTLNDTDSFHSDTISNPQDSALPSETLNVDIQPSDSISVTGRKESAMVASDSKVSIIPDQFIFKFKSPSIENHVHRILVSPTEGIDKLRELIDSKLQPSDYEALNVPTDFKYAISYVDDEGDIVSITSDHDMIDCIRIHSSKSDKANLYLHDPFKPLHKEAIKRKSGVLVSNEMLIGGSLMIIGLSALIGYALRRN